MEQLREVWRSWCTRDNVEADESCFVHHISKQKIIVGWVFIDNLQLSFEQTNKQTKIVVRLCIDSYFVLSRILTLRCHFVLMFIEC